MEIGAASVAKWSTSCPEGMFQVRIVQSIEDVTENSIIKLIEILFYDTYLTISNLG